MPSTKLNLVKRCGEFIPRAQRNEVPLKTRGIYALLKQQVGGRYKVVYIGIATKRGGIKARLQVHVNRWNEVKWSHFSFFEMWHNIPNSLIQEIEFLFLHIFRKHKTRGSKTLKLNTIMKSRKLKRITFEFDRYNRVVEQVENLYRI
jgi:hypothetical protein